MLANTCYAAFCPAASIADFVYDFAGDVYLLIRQGASLYAYVCLCMLMFPHAAEGMQEIFQAVYPDRSI